MNKQELIENGYLEAYLTGDLTEQEKAEVQEALTDEDVLKEYLHLQHDFEKIVFSHSIDTPQRIKEALLSEISTGRKSGAGISYSVISMAASILVGLSSVIAAFYYHNQWQETDEQLSQMVERNIQIAAQYKNVNNELESIRDDLTTMVDPEFSRIVLSGTENAPETRAIVYWNPSSKEVVLNSYSLPALAADQQYQLWALIDGQPVDAGVFDANQLDVQNMKQIAAADAFAVTVEPRGGSENPTLSKLQVIGNTQG